MPGQFRVETTFSAGAAPSPGGGGLPYQRIWLSGKEPAMTVRRFPPAHPFPEGWEVAGALCGLLSQRPRLQMIMFLAAGEHEVGDVGGAVGLGQPLATYHLRVLRGAGIVAIRRAGRRVLYRLKKPAALASAAGVALRLAHGRAQFTLRLTAGTCEC